jgi:hypothetical protein
MVELINSYPITTAVICVVLHAIGLSVAAYYPFKKRK